MRIGVTLPSMGHLAQTANLVRAAKEAERLAYDTLWVADRLLYPIKPRTKYPVTPDGSLSDIYKRVGNVSFLPAHSTMSRAISRL